MVLRVRDTGAGIPEPELPRIFERFHRVEGAVGRSYEGTGIGLALVQELVRLHGGDDRRRERGRRGDHVHRIASARHRAPASRPAARAAYGPRRLRSPPTPSSPRLRTGPDRTRRPTGSKSSARPHGRLARARSDSSTRIVVADDNADMRGYLQRLLGQRWSVVVAADGREALEAARVRPPDLLITDVMMPGLDGFGLLRELRDDDRTHAIPVMMLSARAGEEARVEGIQAGADDYLVKPFSARELVAKVEAQLLRVAHPADRRGHDAADRGRVRAGAGRRSRSCAAPTTSSRWRTRLTRSWSARPVLRRRVAEAFPEVVSQGFLRDARRRAGDGPAVGRPGAADRC